MGAWDQDKYIKAWNYASLVHRAQLLPASDIPYINHIGLVAMEAMAAIEQSDNIDRPDLLVACALLHDTIEDTEATFADIERLFGKDVAGGVMALSKDKNLGSKELQMLDSLQRIKREPNEIWMVKLADRITNLQPPPKHWDKNKIAKYKREAIVILQALGEANAFLAQRLEQKIEAYAQYE